MNADRWRAGWEILSADDQTEQKAAAYGCDFFKVNRDAVTACHTGAVQDGRDQRRFITVKE
jgi:hypothetical protein